MRSKNYGINVRVTEQEKQKLLENARFCSLSLSEYLRRLGLGKEVRAAITERDLPPVSDAAVCGKGSRLRTASYSA